MWIKQKGFLLISIRLSAFRLWIPISLHVLFELIYAWYDVFSFFVLITGQSRQIRIDGKKGRYLTSLKDIDSVISSAIYLLESVRDYESFELVDIDVIDKQSRHVEIKVSFI